MKEESVPELNVFFFGLICHVDHPDENRRADFAALVSAGDHRPTIHFGPNAEDIYELESDVSFTPVEPAAVDDSFTRYVPKLRELLGGQLAIDDGDAVIAQYAKGDGRRSVLTVADTYDCTAIHKSTSSNAAKGPERVVARLVRLRVPLDGETITVKFTGVNAFGRRIEDATIPSNSCILIANAENTLLRDAGIELQAAGADLRRHVTDSADAAQGLIAVADRIATAGKKLVAASASLFRDTNHFEHYSKLVAGGDRVAAIAGKKVEKDPPSVPEHCRWVLQYIDDLEDVARASTLPECGNTNWP